MNRILAILAFLESSGNPSATNADAVGILQIRPAVVRDVNERRARRGLKPLPMEARRCPVLSRVIAVEYMQRYCGPLPTMEEAAALWRCGPTGRRNPTEGQRRYIQAAVEMARQQERQNRGTEHEHQHPYRLRQVSRVRIYVTLHPAGRG
jgi:hypothetical protein